MTTTGKNSSDVRKTLTVDGKEYDYFSLEQASKKIGDISRLPFSLKVLLENMLRFEDGRSVTSDDAKAISEWQKEKKSTKEIAYRPARVLMQDFTGVPAVVDLAAMREAMVNLGGDPKKINPLSAVDLVIDHSVMVDAFGSDTAFETNVDLEFERNRERYTFLRWGSKAFDNFRVVPPGTGICHQVNLEYLGQTVWAEEDKNPDYKGRMVAYPDTLVGTDSHTTMINALATLGWGVGGIEAEAAMLGQPISMLIPEVIGFKLTGSLQEGATATDLVLTVTQMLRAKGVVGKFVEFYGEGLSNLSLADRATISNMAPEYGATCGFFPIDEETVRYLEFTGRDPHRVALVEAYAKEQGLWRKDGMADPIFTDSLELDMGTVESSISGPKRPQDKILLKEAVSSFDAVLDSEFKVSEKSKPSEIEGKHFKLDHGHVVIAAITSCTNTSNPSVMVAAGLVAKKAREKGLKVKPWVKTSLAPGSQVVTDYLLKADLQADLDALGFNLVGYGCTTCIGNSGPLSPVISQSIQENNLVATSVLSGNRNFEGRISPDVKANYLASPPLVVAYALAGSINVDLYNDPLGQDEDGNDVYMKDIWPSNQEIRDTLDKCLTAEMFKSRYADVFKGPEQWQVVKAEASLTYDWDETSTYVKNPPFFDGITHEVPEAQDIVGAKALGVFGDSVTTDHISPAGAIKKDSPAGSYLLERQIAQKDFNSFGSRRGNHEVMMRGTFANIRIKNEMVPGVEGGYTIDPKTGEQTDIFNAAMDFVNDETPLVVIAGKEYGTGSSRDWAAKGTRLLGVKAVVAESFERIHRSNLIGMGVLPLQFKEGETRDSLNITGKETFDIKGLESMKPRSDVDMTIHYEDGSSKDVSLLVRVDTEDEMDYYLNEGILHYVLRNIAKEA